MEQALENYDICTEMLQSSTAIQAEAGAEQRDIVIRLPNLHNDSVVSLEEVSRSFLSGVSSVKDLFWVGTVKPGPTCPQGPGEWPTCEVELTWYP